MIQPSPRLRLRTAGWVILALLPLPSTGQVEESAASYRIGPNDLVSIEVLEDESLNAETRITAIGTVELPPIEPIAVSGLTTAQAAQVLEEAFERYLQRATVTLRVIEHRSQPITVLGAVRKPGALPFSGRWTLLDAIRESGGLAESAGGRILILRRSANGLADQLEIDSKRLLELGDPDVNIALKPNDLINVPTATNVTIYCMGEVQNPGAVVFRSTDQITLVAALARVGGRSERASNSIVVRRSGSGEEIRADYKKLLSGRQADIELRNGDVVIVKESFF